MKTSEKASAIEKVKKIANENDTLLIIHYRGLSDYQITKVRRDLKKLNSGILISKNTLAKIAFVGTPAELLVYKMTGPTAIIYSSNIINIAKFLYVQLGVTKKMQYVTGAYNGEEVDIGFINKVASFGSEELVKGKLIGILTCIGAKLISTIEAKVQSNT